MDVGLPAEVPLPERCVALAAGYFHTLCLGESGAVWAFGCNGKGQLGAGPEGGECAALGVPVCDAHAVAVPRERQRQPLKPCSSHR